MKNKIRKISNKIYEEVGLNVAPIINCISEKSITFTYDYYNSKGNMSRISLSIITDDDIFYEESFSQILKKNIDFAHMTIHEHIAKQVFMI